MSRCGKHKEGNKHIGAFVSPQIKALADLASKVGGKTATVMMVEGILHEAHAVGITDKNGNVMPEYRDILAAIIASYGGLTKPQKSAQ